MPFPTRKIATPVPPINEDEVVAAVDTIIALHRPTYVSLALSRTRATKTVGRHSAMALAAGRDAVAAVLFARHPELGGNFGKLTRALRAGCGQDVNFESINRMGASALGL